MNVSLMDPIKEGSAHTPSDTDRIRPTRGIYMGVEGDLRVELLSGDVVTFGDLVGGVIHPIRATRILATGTTAASVLVLR